MQTLPLFVLISTIFGLIDTQLIENEVDTESDKCEILAHQCKLKLEQATHAISLLKKSLAHAEERAVRAEKMLYRHVSGTETEYNNKTGEYESTTCEHKHSYISCDEEHSIEITYANYGRVNNFTCPNSYIKTQNCVASNSTEIVNSRCKGTHSCSVHATNSLFGDPCVHTFKYLQINYKCIQPISDK